MMDRFDPYGAYRYIDREVYFNHCCLFCLYYINKKSPDFLLFAESPHSVFQYVMYEIAVYLNIKIYSFAAWSVGPVMHLREGIFGKPLKKLSNKSCLIDLEVKRNYLEVFFEKFKDGEVFDPIYMINQKEFDNNKKSVRSKVKSVASVLKKSYRYAFFKSSTSSLDVGVLQGSRFAFLEPLLKKILIDKRKESLRKELLAHQSSFDLKTNEYVYFPLHYEPERTTVPDGMEFYDQFKALVTLRQLVPRDVPIVVKEHYSQITEALSGYKGRSAYFYSLISKIEGVKILPIDYNGKDLIKNSVLTSTITGTAALEAACLNIPALVFGNPWFLGAPGVKEYKDDLLFEDVIDSSASGSEEVKKWMMLNHDHYGVFGCVNPSNEKVYRDIYANESVRENELLGIYNLVVMSISDLDNKLDKEV